MLLLLPWLFFVNELESNLICCCIVCIVARDWTILSCTLLSMIASRSQLSSFCFEAIDTVMVFDILCTCSTNSDQSLILKHQESNILFILSFLKKGSGGFA